MSFEDRQYKCQVDIDAAPSGTSSDVTVVFTEDMLPSQMFDADGVGPAQSDFGDVAIYGSSDGSGRFSLDVVESTTDNDPANGTCEVNARDAASLYVWSSVAVNPVYVAWHTAGTSTQPAASATYGSDAAYGADTKAVWTLQETSGTRLDRTSNDNDLTDNNTVTSAAGQIGDAASFVRANSEVLSIDSADRTGLDFTSDFSVMGWIRADSLPGNMAIVAIDDVHGTVERSYYVELNSSNKIRVLWWDSGLTQSRFEGSTTLSSGTWYHVAVAADISAPDAAIYINGVAETVSTLNSGATSIDTNAITMGVGGRIDAGGTINISWDGRIDDLRMASGQMSAADISFHYNNTSDPAAFASVGTPELTYAGTVFDVGTPTAYYRLGESSGTTANDVSGNGYDGTYTNTPTLGVTGLLSADADTAVTFDSASSEYVSVDVSGGTYWGTLGSSLGSGFSCSFLLNVSSSSGVIDPLGGASSGGTRINVQIDATPKITVQLRDDSAAFTSGSTGTLTIRDGEDHHVVISVDPATDTILVWIDGASESISYNLQDTPSNFSDLNSFAAVGAGDQSGSLGDYFDGTLDEVAIYNKVLNSTEAGDLFTASGLSSGGSLLLFIHHYRQQGFM